MGLGGISIWQLLIIMVIVVLLFGTKKLRNIGGDLGGAIKSFRKSMKDGEAEADEAEADGAEKDPEQIEAKAKTSTDEKDANFAEKNKT